MMSTTQEIIIGSGYGLAVLALSELARSDPTAYQHALDGLERLLQKEVGTRKISIEIQLLYAIGTYDLETAEQHALAAKILQGDAAVGELQARFYPEFYRASFYSDISTRRDGSAPLISEIRSQLSGINSKSLEESQLVLRGLQAWLNSMVDDAVKYDSLMA